MAGVTKQVAGINRIFAFGARNVSLQPTLASIKEYKSVLYAKDGCIASIILNRPKRKNALDYNAYEEIFQVLLDAENDPNISFVTMTGTGDYYCSGNDLANFVNNSTGNFEADLTKALELIKKYVAAYIDFSKPLIAIVNGPAIGIAVTTLALFDLVFASDKATFVAPFSALGIAPEGCSSYTFPILMGPAKANEILMAGKKINAKEAYERGLVTEVIPDSSFKQVVAGRLKHLSELPAKSLRCGKQTFRNIQKELLHEVNAAEIENLYERFQSRDSIDAVMNFLSKSSKL